MHCQSFQLSFPTCFICDFGIAVQVELHILFQNLLNMLLVIFDVSQLCILVKSFLFRNSFLIKFIKHMLFSLLMPNLKHLKVIIYNDWIGETFRFWVTFGLQDKDAAYL